MIYLDCIGISFLAADPPATCPPSLSLRRVSEFRNSEAGGSLCSGISGQVNVDCFLIPGSLIRNSEAGGSADIGPPSSSRDRDGIGRRDVVVTSCCHYNISEAEAIELSHRKPACPGAVCSTQSSNSIGCLGLRSGY